MKHTRVSKKEVSVSMKQVSVSECIYVAGEEVSHTSRGCPEPAPRSAQVRVAGTHESVSKKHKRVSMKHTRLSGKHTRVSEK